MFIVIVTNSLSQQHKASSWEEKLNRIHVLFGMTA